MRNSSDERAHLRNPSYFLSNKRFLTSIYPTFCPPYLISNLAKRFKMTVFIIGYLQGVLCYKYRYLIMLSWQRALSGGWQWWVIMVLWAGRQTDFRCGHDSSLRGCLRGKGLCIGRPCGQVGCIDHVRRVWQLASSARVKAVCHKLCQDRLLHHTPPRCRLCQIATIQQGGL